MGREWLETVASLLTAAGIRADEEYGPEAVPEITEPVAAVGLSGLECAQGQAVLSVRILSPRGLGGWECQCAAVKAVAALDAGGLRGQMGKMSDLDACDCYCVPVTVEMDVCLRDGEWVQGNPWVVQAGTVSLSHVSSFVSEQDQQRRLLGAVSQAQPVGVTPGTGGWTVRLVQQIPQGCGEQEMPEEPFALTVSQGERTQVYSGCCWNTVRRECSQAGMTVEWQGFALSREVS